MSPIRSVCFTSEGVRVAPCASPPQDCRRSYQAQGRNKSNCTLHSQLTNATQRSQLVLPLASAEHATGIEANGSVRVTDFCCVGTLVRQRLWSWAMERSCRGSPPLLVHICSRLCVDGLWRSSKALNQARQ